MWGRAPHTGRKEPHKHRAESRQTRRGRWLSKGPTRQREITLSKRKKVSRGRDANHDLVNCLRVAPETTRAQRRWREATVPSVPETAAAGMRLKTELAVGSKRRVWDEVSTGRKDSIELLAETLGV